MRRGTTPTHKFRLPFSAETVSKFKVIYAQDDVVILTKENESCECNGNVITVRLTQEETLLFDSKKIVQIQIRILTLGGDALASDIKLVDVDNCLESEVIE
jgi:hypothetical protein